MEWWSISFSWQGSALSRSQRTLNPLPNLTPFEINLNVDCKPDFITQPQCPPSPLMLWLNGSKSLAGSDILGKAFQITVNEFYYSMLMDVSYKWIR